MMTVRELVHELLEFDGNLEIHIEVKGWEAPIKGISLETDRTSSWVLLNDYPDKDQK